MDFEKYIEGVMNASPEKRYKTFLSTAADTETVCVLSNENGFAMYGDETGSYLLVWPKKEFAAFFICEGDKQVELDVHDFIELCRQTIKDEKVMVFPTNRDSFVISGENLAEDLEAFLDEVE